MPDQNNNSDMVFDSQPVSSSLAVPDTQAHPSATDSGADMTFDSAPVPLQTPEASERAAGDEALARGNVMRANDPDNPFGHIARWAEQVSNDVKYGTDITGIGTVLKKMGAHGVYAGNPQAVGDFIASVPLGLLRVGKGMANLGQAKTGSSAVQGVKDTVGGLAQATEMPSMVIAPESPELADAVGAGTDAVLNAVPAASKATGKALASSVGKTKQLTANLLHPELVGQQELQTAVRDIANKAAQEAGSRGGVSVTGNPTNPIEPADSSSIRNVFRNLADAVEARAQKAYAELDAATGGNVSRFDKELRNVETRIRNSTGIDESTDAALEARKAAIEAKQEEAFQQAEKNGVPRERVEQARADWKQKSALNDLDTHLKKSTPVTTGNTPVRIDPSKLQTRITNMHDSGRLHEAIGPDNADELLDHAVKAATEQKKALARQRVAKTVGKAAAYATGTGLAADLAGHISGEW